MDNDQKNLAEYPNIPDRKELEEKAKRWFGDGEVDVDLMISCGVISIEQIVHMYMKEVLGFRVLGTNKDNGASSISEEKINLGGK